MSERADHQARAGLSTLGVALIALLAQAVFVHAQIGDSRSAGEDTPHRSFDAPRVNLKAAASAGPAFLALADVAGVEPAAAGGLWLSGNTAGGLTYLHWIAGNPPGGLLKLDRSGKVSFDAKVLAGAAGIKPGDTGDQRRRIASFVRASEGLRLIAELTNGAYRYLLHIGSTAPTRAGNIRSYGVINLDERYDSRVNPLRRDGKKIARECPPQGFDSLIAIDPDVCWFNLDNRRLVSLGQMIFHELAEAHARVALGLDYLPEGEKPGAHDVAIDREIRLKEERPWQFIVMPVGFNIRLVSRNDWLRLFARLVAERPRERNYFER